MKILEANIRQKLMEHLKEIHVPDSLILSELGISEGRIIADLAVINHGIHGFEIKSHYDSFLRLPKQVKYYDFVFDTNTLVYAGCDDELIKSHIPPYWGMMKVEENNEILSLKIIREAQPNPKQKIIHLVKLLWREETLKALNKHNLSKGYTNKRRSILWRRLTENVSQDEIKGIILSSFKSRDTWKK
jgi:hypothetical protein